MSEAWAMVGVVMLACREWGVWLALTVLTLGVVVVVALCAVGLLRELRR